MDYHLEMKTWNSPAGELKLERMPFRGDRSHTAWDSADEWILRRFPEHDGPVLIIGEAFGVLGTAWSGADICAAGDSSLAFRALEHNRSLNPKNGNGTLSLLPSTEKAPEGETFKRIFIRIPKDLSLLDLYIRLAVPLSAPDTEIWLGAMDKRWNRGVKALTDLMLEIGEVFKFEKKARWIRFRPKEGTPLPAATQAEEWELSKLDLRIRPLPGVFSGSGLDEGTAAFMEAFPERLAERAEVIADAGCGSGLLGLAAARLNPEARLIFTDESFLAVRCAEENFARNDLPNPAVFMTANGLEGIEDGTVDLVLLNPPFHFRNIQSREPAAFLFEEARRVLRPGGTVQVVGNNHLGYHRLLGEYFGRVKTVGKNRKFTVLRAGKAEVRGT